MPSHGAALPDISRPSGFLSSKSTAPDKEEQAIAAQHLAQECCNKTRNVGAPCPIGRKCPHDPAPVAALVTEAENYVRASDPLMAGMGDGKGEPWVPEKFVEKPKLTEILVERGSRYGRFETNANISQDIKNVLHATPKWMDLEADQAEAMEMFASKISRILTGDPDYADNWRDIAGFATLVADRLEGK